MNNKKKKIFFIIFVLVLALFIILFKVLSNSSKDYNKVLYIDMDDVSIQYYLDKLPFNNERIGLYEDAYYGNKLLLSDASLILLDMFVYKYTPYELMAFTQNRREDIDEDYYIYNEDEVLDIKTNNSYDNNTIIHLMMGVNGYINEKYNSFYYSLKSNDDIEVKFINYKKSKYIGFVKKNEKIATECEVISLERKAAGDNKDLIIYEKALIAVKDNNKFKIYKNSNINDSKNLLKTINTDNIESVKESLKEKEYTTFKHTFKRNDNNDYYWYSSEVMK